MTPVQTKSFLALLGLSFIASFFVMQPLLGERECCEGDRWLRWNQKTRETYIYAYSIGYEQGHNDGCRQGTKGWPDKARLGSADDPTRKCIQNELDFSKGTEYYSGAVTEFYRQYPKDRIVLIHEVIEQLARGLTLEQIHKYPFMRPSQ